MRDGMPSDSSHEGASDGSKDASEDAFDAPPDASEDADSATEDMDAGPCTTTCVPPAPSGWTGPEELYDNTASPPACGPDFNFFADYDGYASLDAPPATCSTCTCVATGVSCTVGAGFFSDSSCMMPCSSGGVALTNGMCTSVSAEVTACGVSIAGTYVEVSGPIVTGGSCTGSKESPTVPPATWGIQSQACSPAFGSTTGTCSAGNVCVPPTDPSYQTAYCIFQSGNIPCPATGYTHKQVFYASHTDSRTCTACTCEPLSSSACGDGAADAYLDMCVTETASYSPLPQSCTLLPDGTTDMEYKQGVITTGSCPVAPGSGDPTGTAVPTDPTTFCCTM
jgi:hypothetical protein